MNLGLIGCGTIALHGLVPAIRRMRGVRLIAVADPDGAARARVRTPGTAGEYADPAELLARNDVDAVVVAAPTHLHAGIGAAVAESGRPFYLEKPIATTTADAERLITAASARGVRAMVGFNRRFHPLFEQARDLVRAGRIGPVLAIQTAFCETIPRERMPAWKQRRATGGGALLDLMSHHVDLIRWFLGDELSVRHASVASGHTDADHAVVELVSRAGVPVQSLFSFRAGYADRLEFVGETGTLLVDRHRVRITLTARRRFGYGMRRVRVRPTLGLARLQAVRWVRPAHNPSYARALGAFVEHVAGSPLRGASLEDGRRSLEIVLAAEEFRCASSC